jgi:hypothetical protein
MPRLLLEIGDDEWVIDGSVGVRAFTDLPTTVVIRDLSDCRAIFSFTARDRGPSAGYRVVVGEGRTFRLQPGTGYSEAPMSTQPSPGDRCPDLPDTATVGARPAAPLDLGVASVVGVLARLASAIRRLF